MDGIGFYFVVSTTTLKLPVDGFTVAGCWDGLFRVIVRYDGHRQGGLLREATIRLVYEVRGAKRPWFST